MSLQQIVAPLLASTGDDVIDRSGITVAVGMGTDDVLINRELLQPLIPVGRRKPPRGFIQHLELPATKAGVEGRLAKARGGEGCAPLSPALSDHTHH